MNKDVVTMFRDEEYLIGLRRLFESFGYKKFKMRKFENYELYGKCYMTVCGGKIAYKDNSIYIQEV